MNMQVMTLLPIAVVAIAWLMFWHFSKDSTVSLSDLIVDENKKLSLSRIGQATALVVSTWAFVNQVYLDKLSWDMYILYMGVWSGVPLAKLAINKSTAAEMK